MNNAFSRLAMSLTLIVAALFVCAPRLCRGQDLGGAPILEATNTIYNFTLSMTGTVGNESFNGVAGLLRLSFPPAGSLNPYQVIIVGFPTANTTNTFYWDSEQGTMESLSNTLRCRMSNRGIKNSGDHFFYLSPALFANEGFVTQHEAERIQQIKDTALPIQVFAQQGTLNLTFTEGRVQGQVTMTGRDPLDNTYVRYMANFSGTRNQGLQNKQ